MQSKCWKKQNIFIYTYNSGNSNREHMKKMFILNNNNTKITYFQIFSMVLVQAFICLEQLETEEYKPCGAAVHFAFTRFGSAQMIVNDGIVLAKFSQHVDSFITIVYICQICLATPTFITNYLTTETKHSDLN